MPRLIIPHYRSFLSFWKTNRVKNENKWRCFRNSRLILKPVVQEFVSIIHLRFKRRRKGIETHRDKNIKNARPAVFLKRNFRISKRSILVSISFKELCLVQKIKQNISLMFKYLFMKIALRIYKNRFIISLNTYFLQDKLIWFWSSFLR